VLSLLATVPSARSPVSVKGALARTVESGLIASTAPVSHTPYMYVGIYVTYLHINMYVNV